MRPQGVFLEVDFVRAAARASHKGQRIDCVHVLGGDLKAKDVRVLADALLMGGLRQGEHVVLQRPAHTQLGSRDAIALGNLDHAPVRQQLAPS